jgi:uncharacterized membrane protein
MNAVTFTLTLAAAIGSGAVGGVFLAFSSFVMSALRRLPPAQGIAAMQAINVTAVTPVFMGALFGTAALAVAAAAATLDDDAGPYATAAALAYLAGVFALTIGFHVPRNTALSAVDASGAGAAAAWQRFAGPWTTGNHVRTAAALAAAAGFTVALHVG